MVRTRFESSLHVLIGADLVVIHGPLQIQLSNQIMVEELKYGAVPRQRFEELIARCRDCAVVSTRTPWSASSIEHCPPLQTKERHVSQHLRLLDPALNVVETVGGKRAVDRRRAVEQPQE